MKKILSTTVALAVMAIFMSQTPSTAYAQGTTIAACVNASDGTLRIVSPSTTCKKNETKISWPSVDTNTLGALRCTTGQTVRFNGTAWVCDPPRFEVRTHAGGVQTVFDNDTGLEWEMKVSCGSADLNNPRCIENTYTWSSSGEDDDGTLFTDFPTKLNNATGSVSSDGITLTTPGCYAGHCDWRVPNIVELRTILNCSNSPPCIDPIFGPTQAHPYWSSTATASNPDEAIVVFFSNGGVTDDNKVDPNFARAVRGGR